MSSENLFKEEFTCQLVTPMLCHGENSKKPEIRVSSIRGALRFWFRAIMGNLTNGDIGETKKWENYFFGGVNNGGQQSKLIIKVRNTDLKTGSFDPLPHKNSNFKIKGFYPNQTFKIQLISFASNKVHKEFEFFKNLFEFFLLVGGIGQRSRRGFGSLVNEDIIFSGKKDINNDINEFYNKINNILIDICDLKDNSDKKEYDWSVLSSGAKEIFTGTEWSKWEAYIQSLMKTIHSQSYHQEYNPDGILPRSLRGDVDFRSNKRQASLFNIKLIKTEKNTLIPVYSFFRSKSIFKGDKDKYKSFKKFANLVERENVNK